MARCLGDNPPYGCGHFKEHQEAARKGWITRRHGTRFAGTNAHKALTALFGEEVSHAHTHPEHKGLIRFKNAGKWYELPKAEFTRLTHEGQRFLREQSHAEKKSERETAKAASAEEKGRIREESARQAQERQVLAARKAEYKSVTRRIRQMGGIRPYRENATTGKTPELEEWRDLPKSVKTSDRSKGFAPDDMAQAINEEYPWLRLETGSDLGSYLENEKRKIDAKEQALHRAQEEKPKVVISQTTGGEWIINRLYKSGEVRGDPGRYPSKAAAERAASSQRAAGAGVVRPVMFGEEQEKRESYGAGLFG